MARYLTEDELMRKVVDRHGWIHTGDLVVLDDEVTSTPLGLTAAEPQ